MRWATVRATALLAACVTGLATGSALALELPPLTSPVMDFARLLSAAERSALEQELRTLERETGVSVVVHTTPSLEGVEIDAYAQAVAERWGVAHGVLLSVAPNEHRVRIHVTRDLEGRLPAALTYSIVQQRILEAFRNRDVPGGIRAGVDEIRAALRGRALPVPPRAVPAPSPLQDLLNGLWKPRRPGERSGDDRELTVFGWIMAGSGLVLALALRGGRLGPRGRSWSERELLKSKVVDEDGLFITHHKGFDPPDEPDGGRR